MSTSRGTRERGTHYPARERSCRKNTNFGTPSEKKEIDVKGFALYIRRAQGTKNETLWVMGYGVRRNPDEVVLV